MLGKQDLVEEGADAGLQYFRWQGRPSEDTGLGENGTQIRVPWDRWCVLPVRGMMAQATKRVHRRKTWRGRVGPRKWYDAAGVKTAWERTVHVEPFLAKMVLVKNALP